MNYSMAVARVRALLECQSNSQQAFDPIYFDQDNARQRSWGAHVMSRIPGSSEIEKFADMEAVRLLPRGGLNPTTGESLSNLGLLGIVGLCARGKRGNVTAEQQGIIIPQLLRSLTGGQQGRLSLTVTAASLAFMLDTTSDASTKVLALESNILQMLRLFLSRGVYPTESNLVPSDFSESHTLTPMQETGLCRLALVRIISLPSVDASESVRSELIAFIRKWWQRLALSAEGSLTASSSYAIPDGQGDEERQVPTLRAVLELMAAIIDTRRIVPWLVSNLRSLASELPPTFLTCFLRCPDVAAQVSSARLLSSFALITLSAATENGCLLDTPCSSSFIWMRKILFEAADTLSQVLASLSTGESSRDLYLAYEPLLFSLSRLICLCAQDPHRLAARFEFPAGFFNLGFNLAKLLLSDVGVDNLLGDSEIDSEPFDDPRNKRSAITQALILLHHGLVYAFSICCLDCTPPTLRQSLTFTPDELRSAKTLLGIQCYLQEDYNFCVPWQKIHSILEPTVDPICTETDCSVTVSMQQSPILSQRNMSLPTFGQSLYTGNKDGSSDVSLALTQEDGGGHWSYELDVGIAHSPENPQSPSSALLNNGKEVPPVSTCPSVGSRTDESCSSVSWSRRALDSERAAAIQAGLLKREKELRAEQEQVLNEAWGRLSALAEAESVAQTEAKSIREWADECQARLQREQEHVIALEEKLQRALIAAQTQAHTQAQAVEQAQAVLEIQTQTSAAALREASEKTDAAEAKLTTAEIRLAEAALTEARLCEQLEDLRTRMQMQAQSHTQAMDELTNAHSEAIQALRSALNEEQAMKENERLRAAEETMKADALSSELANHKQLLQYIRAATTAIEGPSVQPSSEPVAALQTIRRMSLSLSNENKENHRR